LGKDKLKRFEEMKGFNRVFQPSFDEYFRKDHHLKNNWVKEIFKNNNPLVLELGCGRGEYTIGLAKKFPDINFIGIDIKGARMWKGSKTAHEENLLNVAFLRIRIEFIDSFFSENEVNEIWLTFPDPQLKKNRKKKRLTGSFFLKKFQKLLCDQGIIHLKTDNEILFDYTDDILKYNQCKILSSTCDLYGSADPDEILSIKTHYEKKFLADEARICYLKFCLPKGREINECPEKP